MIFLKEYLQNNHYHWTGGTNHSSGNNEPDRRIFDRFNGNQVLFLINYFGQSIGKMSLSEGQRIEELIFTKLPFETKSELSVYNWLRGIYLNSANEK